MEFLLQSFCFSASCSPLCTRKLISTPHYIAFWAAGFVGHEPIYFRGKNKLFVHLVHDVNITCFFPPSRDENNVGELCEWVNVCSYFQKLLQFHMKVYIKHIMVDNLSFCRCSCRLYSKQLHVTHSPLNNSSHVYCLTRNKEMHNARIQSKMRSNSYHNIQHQSRDTN